MESLVRKRSGKLVPFSRFRIVNAVFKAMKAVGIGAKEDAERIADAVSVQLYRSYFKKGDIPHVETIQDIIEKTLMEKGFPEVAKAYILYREKRREAREIGKALVDGINLIEEYLGQDDWRVKENSNMNYSLQGLNFHVSSSVVARYWLEKLYPQEVAQAHKEGDFHIHDLGSLSPYCVGWDLYDLLMRGFGGVYGKVESSPPKHFRSALGQIVNFFYTLQGESAGAQAFSNFDTLLAPFVRYDKLSYEEVKQCMQEFLFNVNVPTRVGFQTPFTNLTFDLKPSKLYRDVNIIIGGKPREEVYGEFHKEMSMINRAFCELMMAGDAKGRIFTFPIPTYNITKDFDWDNPDYEPLWEMTRKYGIPYFANFVNSDMDPDDARSMCLAGDEEILIKNSETIKRVTIKDVAEYYKASDFDKEGWAECKADGNLRVLSLNPSNFKLEWVGVKRFLKITDSRAVEIITEDGKKAIYSLKHPLPIYTPQGIKMKFAKDVLGGDILLVLKKTGEGILKEDYQKIGDYILDEDLAKILGFFIADGNYLFETRKNLRTYGKPRGLQFTFKADDEETIRIIKTLLQKKFGLRLTEKKDLRYNTYYIYVYNTHISRVFYEAGFKKYGRLPQVIFNSAKSVIQSFLDFFMRGDGYLKRKEIHLNDKELARDLVLLFSLIGQPVTYKERKNSQRIYLQHSKSLIKQTNYYLNNPLLSERVPGWTAQSTYKVPGLKKTRMVGLNTLDKYMAHTEESLKFKEGDVYPVRVKEVKILEFDEPKEFYDLELERNHLFIHSLGQVSFNCCRLRLDQRELRKRGGGLFGANPLTGSLGVVTINLPRIGYLSTCEEEFFERLERLMELAKISLEIKRKVIEDFTEKGLYPYSKVYLQGVKEARGQYWANHFSTIGIVGMNECTLNFLGEPIYTKAGKEFALKVLKFMREKISDYQETTGNLYNLEATPAEGTSYRLARIDKKKFPRIKTQGTPEVPYYTNSVHLPVYYSDDIFEILTHQDELQIMFTGGTVVHLFVGEEITDRVVVKELVKAIVNRFRLPYFSITPTFSVCPVHGYIPGKHEICPFPHTEEELNRFGTEIVIPASLINKLSEGAVKISE